MKILRIPLAVALVVLGCQMSPAHAQTLTFLHSFTNSPDGRAPVAGLVEGNDGNFYGTTEFGGVAGSGIVFRISPSGTFTNLHSFTNSPDGNTPVAGLVLGSDGNLYGTTQAGGTNGPTLGGFGTIFRISPSGVYTSLYHFAGPPGDGNAPTAGLVEGSDSNFYGTTYGGGTNGQGTVFRFSPSGVETTLYSFPNSLHDGAVASAGLVLGSDGNFYGMTQVGGANEKGTIFQISASGTYTSLYSFGSSTNDGFSPVGALVEGSDSNLYGTTLFGGTTLEQGGDGDGTVFRISPSGVYTSLYSFTGFPGGALPEAGLVVGSDSNFYGTTESGGNPGLGTAFRITPSGVVTTLCTFIGGITNGSGPFAPLVLGSDGHFYGTTAGGGPNNAGTVFKLTVGGGLGGGGGCTYTINPTNASIAAAGGSATISVTASNGCAWSAMSSDSFINITSSTNGSGNGTIHYTVAANTNTTGRVGTITLQDQTLTITQAGASAEVCDFTLSPADITLTAKGGSKSVSVKVKGADCAWTAVSNDPFITITSGSSGTGNGKVAFTVPGNTNTTALVGTITIAGQTFTVNQAIGGCTFKLSPKSAKFKSTGGVKTVKVTPNLADCDWTAVSNDPSLITITAGASGTGKGAVSYTISANATTNNLTGSMTIAGQTYTVTQSGEK